MNLYQPTISGSLTVSGSVEIIGPFTMSGGSISGTSSFAANAGLLQGLDSTSFVGTGSFNSMSSSVSTRVTKIEGNYATTGSNIFTGAQTVCANITSTGTIIAQTLNVQQVTSSIVYSSGSNIFGCSLSNTQQFTGSFGVTGSSALFSVGCVGIGVCTPAKILHVHTGANAYTTPTGLSGTAVILGTNFTNYSELQLIGSASYGAGILLGDTNGGQSGSIYQFGGGAGENGRMRINAGGVETLNLVRGNVGIGCSNPQAKLDIVRGSSGDNIRLIGSGASDYSDIVIYSTNNATRLGYIDWSNTQVRWNVEANVNLVMYTCATERLAILNNGRVIINQACTAYHQLSVKSNGNLTYNGLGVYSSTNDRFISINHTGTIGYIETENAGSGCFTDLVIRTGANDRVYITSGGNVGIGTSNCCLSERLTVLGTGWFTDVVGVGGCGGQLRVVKNAASTPATMTIFGYDNLSVNQAAGAINFDLQLTGACGQTAASIRALNGDINESSAHLAFYTTTNSGTALAGVASTERMRITCDGLVGIGTCTPGSVLHVKGGTQAGADFGSELRVWENSFGAQVQGSTIGSTYAFFGTFRYNFANAANSRSNYYNSGYGIIMKDGVGILSSTAGGSTCSGCTFTPNQRLFIAPTGEACFSCQICTPGVNITSNPIGVEYLLVAGGGGGGWDVGGGGGAGGVLRGSTGLYAGVYNVSIGAGGAGSPRSCHVDGCQAADRGNNSYAIGLTALGGGGGGNYAGGWGAAGASGGGGAGYGATTFGGLGMFGSGCNGGDSVPGFGTGATGGGGGGATGPGCPSVNANGACSSGGPGVLSSIIGTSCSFGCGGRGGGDSWTGQQAGPANSGYGGDGAGSALSNIGSNGGSGIFVIKMLCSNSASFSGGLTTTTCTNVLGYRIYVVTAGTGTMTIS